MGWISVGLGTRGDGEGLYAFLRWYRSSITSSRRRASDSGLSNTTLEKARMSTVEPWWLGYTRSEAWRSVLLVPGCGSQGSSLVTRADVGLRATVRDVTNAALNARGGFDAGQTAVRDEL